MVSEFNLSHRSNFGMGILRSIQLAHMGEIKIIYKDYTLFLAYSWSHTITVN